MKSDRASRVLFRHQKWRCVSQWYCVVLRPIHWDIKTPTHVWVARVLKKTRISFRFGALRSKGTNRTRGNAICAGIAPAWKAVETVVDDSRFGRTFSFCRTLRDSVC